MTISQGDPGRCSVGLVSPGGGALGPCLGIAELRNSHPGAGGGSAGAAQTSRLGALGARFPLAVFAWRGVDGRALIKQEAQSDGDGKELKKESFIPCSSQPRFRFRFPSSALLSKCYFCCICYLFSS